jgi:hypothetical protein
MAAAAKIGSLSEKNIAKKAMNNAKTRAKAIAMVKKRITRKRVPKFKIRTTGSLGGKGAWNDMKAALNNMF